MPVGVKEVVIPEISKKDTDTKLAAKRLLEFEEELYSDKPQKLKRKRNEQLIQDEKDESTEEGLENVNAENSTIKVNEKIVKKKKKVQSKINDTDKNQYSEESNEDSIDSKNKKCNTAEMIRKNSNCKFKKESPPLVKKCKKLKLKGNKTAGAITPVKRKKSTMLTISDKWDVSDNIDSSSSLSLSNGSDSNSEKNNILTKQPTWLVPVLKKLENEKSVS